MPALNEIDRNEATVRLRATLPPQPHAVRIGYRTRTGALLRVDGSVAGAFDREHREVVLAPSTVPRELTFDVEMEALPTHGLPSGAGLMWWYLQKRSKERAATAFTVHEAPMLPVIGHSHLDVAWLWTYEQASRKASRTFAIACDLLDRDAAFRFIQSQPQLYSFVQQSDEQLFARVLEHVRGGRFDPDVAALWVESDCNIPSGESLLRQMLHGRAYCERHLGVTPQIAWLPDSFGFANTLPQLLAHAGIPYFATTKLQWNDTTKFPYPQFVWNGPDGSGVVAALIQSYDGAPYSWRIAKAAKRGEPLVVGYGDGGGGVTAKMLAQVPRFGHWIRARGWFDRLSARREQLPVHADELYLEYHRGVYTTHHDVKFHNALLERALWEAEELLAWCAAVHAPKRSVDELCARLRAAWEILLRSQFHDVLPGTSTAPVYEDAAREYAAAEELTAGVIVAAQAMLPRAPERSGGEIPNEPREQDDGYTFDNGTICARVTPSGTLVELRARGGPNVCTQANVLALYRDKPRQWEAWNLDRGYERHLIAPKPVNARVEAGVLIVDFKLGRSAASMRVALHADEPFLRVELEVDWRERRRLLRVENWLPLRTKHVIYGSPHGTVVRSALARTPAERAKFEVPGQRFAAARDEQGNGVAFFALDTYGWNARALPKGGVRIGHSLLRSTSWPDPHADTGTHTLSYAFAPFAGASDGALERTWLQFAHERRVRLFTCEDEAVLVAACKPSEDGDGVIVRVRECDGAPRTVRVRCGARLTAVHSVDAQERASDLPVSVDGEHAVFHLTAFQLRSFRVRFSHEI